MKIRSILQSAGNPLLSFFNLRMGKIPSIIPYFYSLARKNIGCKCAVNLQMVASKTVIGSAITRSQLPVSKQLGYIKMVIKC